MDHNDIRHKLSDYLDGAVTDTERTAIEEHLKSCAVCGTALSELLKTIEAVRQVEELEPPAWMSQKIMARVREEAARKRNIFQRLFHPLAVKLPLQTVAVLFLAVTAFYIYRSIQPEMRFTETPAPMLEAKKELPAPGRAKGAASEVENAAPKQQAPQAPGYRSLDMKYAYEKPAPPALKEQAAEPALAAAPAPMKQKFPLAVKDKDELGERSAAATSTDYPAPMAERSAPRTAKTTPDLQKYIGRYESELASFQEISTDKADQGFSMIGNDHLLLTRKVYGALVIFFAKFIYSGTHRSEGAALITDAMIYPASGENWNLVEKWCTSHGQADIELMAVVDTSLKMQNLPAIKAWRMNRKTGKFESINPANIACINESYGN